ncbi:DUF3817 domain-containing protein [Dietzia sp.]|uniref:DUF3817 domain-containing protein n=1 Tax=Dietzia sp. TaxID=1871616 RepID=UPI002FD9AA51
MTTPETDQVADPEAQLKKISGALTRYRILAWTTGIWLLLLVAEMIAYYGFGVENLKWIAIVHGWMYMAYLLFTLDLGVKVRWPWGKLLLTCLAGTIPFLSFYFEHIRSREVKAQIEEAKRSVGLA